VDLNLPVPRVALAIPAHPDDAEFGCGGTFAKWAAAGCRIHHLVCTDGSKGTWDPKQDVAELVTVRQDEQRAASHALGGAGDVVFLGWPDGELDAGVRQRWQVAYWIRRLRPDVVLGHDPWRRYRLHPDHRAAGFLLTDAVVAARDPHFFPEQGEPPHRPGVVLLWEAEEPDHVEDITAHFDAKIEALLAHRSQYRSTMRIEDAASGEEVAAFRRRVAEWAADQGANAGVALAERFKAITQV